jgi:single-strand DNA-binding protein
MINRIVLMGRLVRDPELRKVANGNSVATFTLAVDNRQKGPDGNWTTSFIPCTAWNNLAEFVSKYFRKGNIAAVDGRLIQRKYDRKDGTKASVFEVNCDTISFGDGKQPATDGNTAISDDIAQPSLDDSKNLDSIDIPDDDLPF